MTTVALTSSPATLDPGTAYELFIVNSGASIAHVQINGGRLFDERLNVGQSIRVPTGGNAVTAYVRSGSGQVDVTATSANPQGAPSHESGQLDAATARGTYTSLANSPLLGVGGRFRTLTIATYHAVPSLATFQTDCDFYQEWNYTTVTLDDVWNHLQGTSTLPDKPLLITFDDGYTTQHAAAQELNTRGMKGTFFIATGWIDGTTTGASFGATDTVATWTQINQWKTWGHDIQAHTITHPHLDVLTDAQVVAEYTGCKARIEAQVSGQTVRHLAYPFGAITTSGKVALAAAGCRLARLVRVNADGTAPAANAGRYSIASTMHDPMLLPTAGTGYLDIQQPNFYRTLSADPELIPDYGFEAGGKGWTLGTNFSIDTNAGNAHSGTKSLTCLQPASTASSKTTRMIPVDPFCRVHMSVWIKTAGLPAGTICKVQNQIYKPDGITVYQTVDAVTVTGNNGGWTNYSYDYYGDMNSGFLQFYCWLQGNASPTGSAWWDDLSVRRENAAGPMFSFRR